MKMKDPLEEIDRGELMTQCLNKMLKFHTNFLDMDITPVWLRDGKAPKEKKMIRDKRKKGREDTKAKIDKLRDKLEKQDIFERSKTDIDALRKLLANYTHVYPEEFMLIYNILQGFGIPLIQCPSEAEAYGSAIIIKRLAFGIWTTDTDCYAFGATNMITGFEGKDEEGNPMISIVHIPYLLEDFEFDQEEMRDFCIMCGTDFNENIPNLGAGRAYTAIKKYRSIEKFEKHEKKRDCSILNYVRSRELLTPPKCKLTLDSPELQHNKEAFERDARELCGQYNLGESYAKMLYHLDREIPIEKYNGKFPKKKKSKIVVTTQKKEEGSSNEFKSKKNTSKKKKEESSTKSKKKEESSSDNSKYKYTKDNTKVKIRVKNKTSSSSLEVIKPKSKKETVELD